MGAKESKHPNVETVGPACFGELEWPGEAIQALLDEVKEARAEVAAREDEGEEGAEEQRYPFQLEDRCQEYGMTALHYAAEAGHVDAVRELLGRRPGMVDIRSAKPERREELDMRDRKAWKEKKARILALASPFAAQCRCFPGTTPLIIASRHGHWEVVEVLLSFGADVGAVDERGRTALHMACQYGELQVVEVLAKHMEEKLRRSLLDAQDAMGQTPIHYLAHGNDFMEHVELYGKEATHHRRIGDVVVVFKSEDDYRMENQVHVLRRMLALGAKPELEDKNGFTPLYYAAKSQPPILAILLQMGCNPEGRIGDAATRYRMWLNGNKYGPDPRLAAKGEEHGQSTEIEVERLEHNVPERNERENSPSGEKSNLGEKEQSEKKDKKGVDKDGSDDEVSKGSNDGTVVEDSDRDVRSAGGSKASHCSEDSSIREDCLSETNESETEEARNRKAEKLEDDGSGEEPLRRPQQQGAVFAMSLSDLSPEGHFHAEKISLEYDDDDDDDDSIGMMRRR